MALGQLASLGMVPGSQFSPTAQQRLLLDRAAKLGDQMASVLSYSPTGPAAQPLFPGTQWVRGTMLKRFDHRDGVATQINERAQLFTFGFSAPRTLTPDQRAVPGKGAAYAISYRAGDGTYLDGARNYEIRIPANVPALSYWSLTAYDAERFDLLEAPSKRPNVSSLMKVKPEKDGTYILRLGPQAKGGNAIQTVPGRAFFVIFRLFAPTEAYLEGKWQLPDLLPAEKQ